MGARFRNPENGDEEHVSAVDALLVLVFGGIYFAVKGVWTHFVLGFVLAICTCGLSWLIYPLFTQSILCAHYRKMGWRRLGAPSSGNSRRLEDREEAPRTPRGPKDDFDFS